MPDLNEQIRELINEGAPPVTMAEIMAIQTEVASHPAPPNRRPRRRSRIGLVAGPVAIAAAVVVAVIVIDTASHQHPVITGPPMQTAATQLHEIALTADRQPAVSPGPNQWLSTHQAMSISAYVSQVGSTSTPDAQATIDATTGTWSNTTGQACVSAATDPAQFASPADQAAWTAAGLIDQPKVQPVTGCDSIIQGDATDTLTQATGVIDVSSLPTDAATLAGELASGTTGIPAVDGVVGAPGNSAAFERAVILLVGPESGATPGFESALYGAIATIPGIHGLGHVMTHSGRVGLGFSAATSLGTTTIIVDSSTGALLEARNVASRATFDVLAIHYLGTGVGPNTKGIGSQGGSYGATILWLDPIGKPTVVGPVTQMTEGDTAIYTIAKPNVTLEQVDALGTTLRHQIGGIEQIQGSASTAVQNNPHVPPATTPDGQIINIGASGTWTFTGTSEQVKHSLEALEATGLFVTILAF